MKVTQGQFSFLPDLNEAEIKKQIEYALDNGWSVAIEYTTDPHPRNCFWSMWGNPMFDLRDPAGVMMELDACRAEHPGKYVKVLAFDSKKGWRACACPSSCSARTSSPASSWCARMAPAAWCITRCAATPLRPRRSPIRRCNHA